MWIVWSVKRGRKDLMVVCAPTRKRAQEMIDWLGARQMLGRVFEDGVSLTIRKERKAK